MTNWAEIVSEHGPAVWRTATRLLTNEADASDCFQRTFVSALEFAREQPVRNWRALLRRIATARAMEQLRLRYRQTGRRADCLPDTVADRSALDPGASFAAVELVDELRRALARIEARQAEVFCLVCLEDCSYRQIAQQLGISVNHVGVLLSRAKASLRTHLHAYAPSQD
jgi:RNA polymerase sigma-70 factor, ECF subfamily